MARKKAGSRKVTIWEKAKWKGFVPARLTQEEREEIKNNPLKPEDASQFFEDAAAAGYKVSLSYSIPEDVYTISLTGSYVQKPNAGLTVSLRHRDYATAIAAMAWCVGQDGYSIEWEDRFGKADDTDW